MLLRTTAILRCPCRASVARKRAHSARSIPRIDPAVIDVANIDFQTARRRGSFRRENISRRVPRLETPCRTDQRESSAGSSCSELSQLRSNCPTIRKGEKTVDGARWRRDYRPRNTKRWLLLASKRQSFFATQALGDKDGGLSQVKCLLGAHADFLDDQLR